MTLVILGNEEIDMERTLINQNEHFKQSGHSVFRGTSALNRGILQRNQQTLNFYFAQFTRQISSVSTEQYRVGVMSQLKRCLFRHSWVWTNPFQT